MPYTKTGPFTDNSASPPISAAFLNSLETAVNAAAAGVYPEAYVQTGDAGDWALAITRALAYATPLGLPVVLQQLYPTKTTITLNSNDALIGRGPRTGLQTPTNAPIVALTATSKSGISLQDFTVDGNCVTLGTKNYTRSIRFISCTNLRADRITTLYNPDWACAFEQCTNVTVTDYTHRAGAATLNGGRDGIHFLDCNDVVLDGAKIHSGDDCVGITSQTQNINRITIRNVTGVSETAAVVTLGNESTSAFTASDVTVENISTYQSPDWTTNAGLGQYVLKLRAQNGALVQRIRASNITGVSVSHAVWLDGGTNTNGMTDVVAAAVNVTSTTNHGVYMSNVQHFELHAVIATAQAGNYDGVHVQNSLYGSLSGSARNSSLWGLQLNACTSVDVVGFIARDNGGNSFASSTGGNGRIVNCADIYVNGGQFVGSATVSYFGLSQSGNTTTTVSTFTRTGGAH